MNNNRITPDNITTLKPNEIFVFGSNEAGIHGAGAAKTALQWGAKWGDGFGMRGQTFAIPTKDRNIKTLPIGIIAYYLETFEAYATGMDKTFLVTEIGCGLAGYIPREIALLFKGYINLNNVYLPRRFWAVIEGES